MTKETSPDIGIICSFLKRLKEPKTSVFDVIKTERIATSKFNENTYSYDYKYRIGMAAVPDSNISNLLIIDKTDNTLQAGRGEYLLKKTKKVPSKLLGFKSWESYFKKFNTVLDLHLVYNPKKVLASMKRSKITFKELHDFVLSDVPKDNRITELVKATTLPIPLSMREEIQPFNPHAIVLTNTGVAKTATYARALGYEPITDFSEPGLLGGWDAGLKTIRAGSLNGIGAFPLDEFPDFETQILDKLLNYMVSGATKRDIMPPVHCKGTKSLIFLGNCEEIKLTGRLLNSNLNALARGYNYARVGRRISLIYYGNNFKPVIATETNVSEVKKAREIVKSIVRDAVPKVFPTVFNYAKSWLQEEDKEYVEAVHSLKPFTEYQSIKDFMTGHTLSVPSIRMAGLKVAIYDYLDELIRSTKKDTLKTVLEYADYQYQQFKSYNLDSFSFVKTPMIEQVSDMLKEGEDWRTIVDKTGISQRTFYAYKKQLEEASCSKNGGK